MRGIVGRTNSILHILVGLPLAGWIVFWLIAGKNMNIISVAILLLVSVVAMLGLGSLLRPERMRRAMLVFHRFWLVLTAAWSLFFWYAAHNSVFGGWGGLFLVYFSFVVYPVAFLSLLTMLAARVTRPDRDVPTKPVSERAQRPGITISPKRWAQLLALPVFVVLAYFAVQGYHGWSEWQVAKQHQQIQREIAKVRSDLASFLATKEEELAEREVFVLGQWLDQHTDFWGTPYRVTHMTPRIGQYNKYNAELEVASAGPDRQFATADDIWLRTAAPELTRRNSGIYFFARAIKSPTLSLLNGLVTERAVRFPHSVNLDGETTYELPKQDKWKQHLRIVYAQRGNELWVTLYSAGMDGSFDTDDDLFVAKRREPVSDTGSSEQYERYLSDAETRLAREQTFNLVRTTAKENSAYARVALQYFTVESPQVLDVNDAWGQALELYHANVQRSLVYVYSRGEDGVRGSADDLLSSASDPNYLKQLASLNRNLFPPVDGKPGLVFFEVWRSIDSDRNIVEIALASTDSGQSRETLRAQYPVMYFAAGHARSCRAELVGFSKKPPYCCQSSVPSTITGRYRLTPGCKVQTWNRAMVVEPDSWTVFDQTKARMIVAQELAMRLPAGFLLESCQYYQHGRADFYYCEPPRDPAKAISTLNNRPNQSYLFVDNELVFAAKDYLTPNPGIDTYGYHEGMKPVFVAAFEYQGRTYYVMASGAAIYQDDNGQWRMSKRRPVEYYGECDCAG